MTDHYDKRINICRSLDTLESERNSTNDFMTDWLKGEKKNAEITFRVDGNTTRYTLSNDTAFECLKIILDSYINDMIKLEQDLIDTTIYH